MSIRCGFNVRQAKRYNTFMRDVQRRYDEVKFFADIGEEPIDRTRAYDLGLEGPQRKCRTALDPVNERMTRDAIRIAADGYRAYWYGSLLSHARTPAEVVKDTDHWLLRQRKRHVFSDDMPALPLDALRMYDAGLERYHLVTEQEAADEAAYWAEHYGFN